MANYTDKPLDFNQQIALLKSNGLAFGDEQKALHTLQQVSYFRMKSYLMPLMDDKVLHTFKSGTTFEQAFELYKFDSRLRKLIASELEKIEVSIRTQMAYILADEIDIYWFSDSNNFANPIKHAATLANLKNRIRPQRRRPNIAFQKHLFRPIPTCLDDFGSCFFWHTFHVFQIVETQSDKAQDSQFLWGERQRV